MAIYHARGEQRRGARACGVCPTGGWHGAVMIGEGAGARSRHTMCEARSEQMLLRVRDMHDAIRTGEAAGWQRSQGVMQCESD